MKFIGITLTTGEAVRVDAYDIIYYGEVEGGTHRVLAVKAGRQPHKFEVSNTLAELDHMMTVAFEARW